MSFWCITDLIVLWLKNTWETWSDLPMFVRMFVDSFLWPTRRCDVVLMHHRPDSSVIEKHFGDLIWPSDVCSDVCGLLSYGLQEGVMSFWCITDLIVLWLKTHWRPDLTFRCLFGCFWIAFFGLQEGVMSFWCITDLIVLWLKNTLETWSDLPMFVRMFVDSFLWPTRRCDVVLMHHRPDSSVIEKHFGDLIWPSDVCSGCLWIAFLWPTRRCDVVLMHHRPDSSVIEKHFGDLIWPSDVCSDVCG